MLEKLKGFKNRLKDRNMFSVVMTTTIFLVLIVGTMANQNRSYMQYIENQNRRAFAELTQSVKNIDISLSKAVLTTEPEMLNKIAHTITENASFAKNSLGQLPLNNTSLDKTQKYLAQVGDYTIYLADKSNKNERLSSKDIEVMINLLGYADLLVEKSSNLEDEYLSKVAYFGQTMKLTKEASASGDTANINEFSMLEDEFQEYPSLLYDGPFSDHLDKKEALFLKGKLEISKEDAEKKALQFVGEDRIEKINYNGCSENTIPISYSFSGILKDKTSFSVDVTKINGEILWFLNNKETKTSEISVEDGISKGYEFITQIVNVPMEYSYYEVLDGFVTINYAPVIDGIKMYTDLIKLKVSLVDGSLVGYESKGFLMNHHDRKKGEFNTVNYSKFLNPKLELKSVKRTLIPKNDGREVYAYEIKGVLNNRKYLVYLNSQTAKTENILLFIENENGVLTE